MKRPVDWVDAFTRVPMGGNGCAVVHDAAGMDDGTCRRFVRETSLVECTFLEPSSVADVKVRYFLASHEIPFAGHPTVATAASLHHRGLLPRPRVSFETGAGIIEVDIVEGSTGPTYTMTQAKPEFGQSVEPGPVAAIYGLSEKDVLGTPQLVSTGLGFVITVLKSLDVLRRAMLNIDALKAHCAALGVPDGTMLEPYLVALEGVDDGDTFARLLMVPPSPYEDPFTGSATGATAAYLWRHGFIERPRYVAEQGHDMGRPGRAEVEVLGPREAPDAVRVGGQAHVLMSGVLDLG